METLASRYHLNRTEVIGLTSEILADISQEDLRLAAEDVKLYLAENRPDEVAVTAGFAVVIIDAKEMIEATKHHPGWLQQGKAEKVAVGMTSVCFNTPAPPDPELTSRALLQAKIAAATKQDSGTMPHYRLNGGPYTSAMSEKEIWGGNFPGAYYHHGLIVSVAGLSAEISRDVAEAVLIKSFDHMQERLLGVSQDEGVAASAA